jgi:NAD(P)H-dependent flavin oxidoreductase YrpB (nitropropane dioxygenase family)
MRAHRRCPRDLRCVSDKVVEILKRPDAKFADVAALVRGAQGRLLLGTGDLDGDRVWAGQAQALVQDVPTVAELMERTIREATEISSRRLPGALRCFITRNGACACLKVNRFE